MDGRDHDSAGTLQAGQGVPGIWTTSTMTQGGNSRIGGTVSGSDFSPAKPGSPGTILTGQTWPGGYPSSPDSVLGGPQLGFPEGTLKALAQSGVGGSQYNANPSTLTYPLRGVTYVELPSGGTWQDMSVEGEGMIVVHNTMRNAIMKNLSTGTFRGLIIADDIIHIHATIIGAIVGLTSSPSEGNCIGNGSGTVAYSTETVTAAAFAALTPVDRWGSGANVIAWWE